MGAHMCSSRGYKGAGVGVVGRGSPPARGDQVRPIVSDLTHSSLLGPKVVDKVQRVRFDTLLSWLEMCYSALEHACSPQGLLFCLSTVLFVVSGGVGMSSTLMTRLWGQAFPDQH